MKSNIYYDTTSPLPGLWTTATWSSAITNWIKFRIVDTIDSPMFAEIWIADPDNAVQEAGTYLPYQRIRIDYNRSDITERAFVGRIEYLESRYDEGYGRVLVLQVRDALQELVWRQLDHDFSADRAGGEGKNHLIGRIIQYTVYTEIPYDTLAGGVFTVATGANRGYYLSVNCGLGDSAVCKIVYDDNVGAAGTLSVEMVVHTDLTNQIATTDAITEFDGDGVATGVTASVNGNLVRNISTAAINALAATQVPTNVGRYVGSSINALEAIREIALSDGTGYDFLLDNGTNAAPIYPPSFVYYARASRTPGVTVGYNVAETDTTRIIMGDYEFPQAAKEGATHIIASGLDTKSEKQERWELATAGLLAQQSKIYKEHSVFQRAQGSQADINNLAAAEVARLGTSTVQRGLVHSKGYLARHDTDVIVRSGELVTVGCAGITAVDGTDMIVVSSDYEEPPGVATIELLNQATGKLEKVWGIYENLEDMRKGIEDANWERWYTIGFPGGYVYSDETGTLYARPTGLRFVDSTDTERGRVTHIPADYWGAGINPAAMNMYHTGTPPVLWLGTSIGARWSGVTGTSIWVYSDAIGNFYFFTRQKDGTTPQDHVFSPIDAHRGRLGDVTFPWLSAHIDNITTAAAITGAYTSNIGTTDGGGSATVTHGLGTTPTSVLVTPVAASGEYVANVSLVGAVTFTVKITRVINPTIDGQHNHGATGLTMDTYANHTHTTSGNTDQESAPGDPHNHPSGSITADAAGSHTHTMAGNTANDTPHAHAILTTGIVNFYWVAFK